MTSNNFLANKFVALLLAPLTLVLACTHVAVADSDADFWAAYDAQYNAECQPAEGRSDLSDIAPEVCACGLKKIKANHTASEIQAMGGGLPGDVVEVYGKQCTLEALDKPGPYAKVAYNAMMENCASWTEELGDEAEPYCICYVREMENHYTYKQVLMNEVTNEQYAAVYQTCDEKVLGQ